MPDDPINLGDVEPDGEAVPSFLSLTFSKDNLDELLVREGLCPTDEIRFTIAQELRKFIPLFLEDTVVRTAGLIKFSN